MVFGYIAVRMTHLSIIPVILSGGSGVRLWPLSRPDSPKQLIPLADERTMLLATLQRLNGIAEAEPPIVVCNAAHVDDVKRDLSTAGNEAGRVIVEPIGRNTAPAVAAAALLTSDGDPILLVMPADHLIQDEEAFRHAVAVGAEAAAQGKLVTFGIVATHPATGYGYIRSSSRSGVRPVEAFVEKPDRRRAESFLASGDYLWNSGMFMFKASAFLGELDDHAPAIAAAVAASLGSSPGGASTHVLDATEFARSPSISIDYAVMEHTTHAVVVPLDAGWTDLGSWNSLYEIGEMDEAGNVTVGTVFTSEVAGSYLRSEGPLIAVRGVTDLVIVAMSDAVLVAERGESGDIRALVDQLAGEDRAEAFVSPSHRHVWGTSTALTSHHGAAVVRYDVEPGHHFTPPAGTLLVMGGSGEIDGEHIEAGAVTRLVPGHESVVSNDGNRVLVLIAMFDAGA